MTRTPLFEPIFLSDAEIAKRLGMPAAEWAAVAHVLERSGLPRKDPMFGERRCWPVVREFLIRRSGGDAARHEEQYGRVVENLDALRGLGRGRRRRIE